LDSRINEIFIKNISKLIYKRIFYKINNKNNIHFAILTIWDFQKKIMPQFHFLFVTDNQKNPNFNIQYSNSWENQNMTLYLKYINYLKNKKVEIHFWDILHKYKKFCTPIKIFKDSNILKCGFINGKGEKINEFIKKYWFWNAFKQDNYFSYLINVENEFSTIIQNYYNLLNPLNNSNFVIYEVPLFLNIEKNDEMIWYRSVGSLSIGLNSSDDNLISNLLDNQITSVITAIITKQYQAVARTNSLRSTVAAIMSRNMSHNLGSHVLSNLKGELDDIGKIFKENHDIDENIPFKSKNLFGLKWFINYLQERQDFIATIGGFKNQTFMPVNFKTFVFDGLLPDHQYKRHEGSTNLHDHKNYLLEYIVKSENINRNQIIIKFKNFESSMHKLQTDNDYKTLTQLNVSFPGGIVGRQAFFSIFENIIRNAAKHNEIKDRLEITIDTPDDNNYNTNEYIKFTITDNLKSFNKTHCNIEKAINEPIFTDGQENQGNKGIKEMKISAAWLRGISLEDIDSFKKIVDLNGFIIRPQIIDFTESNGSLQYIFYLLKPKELLIYLDSTEKNNLSISSAKIKLLNENGIDIYTPKKFHKRKNHNLRHSLFIIPQQEQYENDTNIEKFFNQRRLYIDLKTLLNTIKNNKNNPQKLITSFWKNYLNLDKDYNLMPYIDIRPHETKKNEKKFERFRVQLNSDDYPNNNSSNIKILFKHHNDTKNTFNHFRENFENLFNGLHFLEGISGGNSTELIANRTEKTELFYYKLLQSCITDIIIIDERLWNNNSKTNITELTDIINCKKSLFNQTTLDKINKIDKKEEWAKNIIEKLDLNENEELLRDVSSSYDDKDEVGFLDFIIEKFGGRKVQKSLTQCKKENKYKYWLYKKKNIDILNIIFNNRGNNQFEFYNLNLEKVGTFSNNELKIETKLLKLNEYPYKILSIHQGVLDKINNHLNDQKNKNNEYKIKINNAMEIIDKAFPANNYIRIIHSGRGTPSVEIPKGFYFVPYASLENAFYDCKYSLTDLLYNAKTELS